MLLFILLSVNFAKNLIPVWHTPTTKVSDDLLYTLMQINVYV